MRVKDPTCEAVFCSALRPGQPNWTAEVQEFLKAVECEMCHRLFEAHTVQEFSDHMDQIAEKYGRGGGWRDKK